MSIFENRRPPLMLLSVKFIATLLNVATTVMVKFIDFLVFFNLKLCLSEIDWLGRVFKKEVTDFIFAFFACCLQNALLSS